MSVFEKYTQALQAQGYQSDQAQLRAVQALQRCVDEWSVYKTERSGFLKFFSSRPNTPQGVYMYGGVGRGKSFLMDCFFQSVPVERKTRLHFHEFMREVHRELSKLQGKSNPLQRLGAQIAQRFELICFDEFHVADVTDAMILHRLLESLFDSGVGFVCTSNFEPDGLYPGGLHRDRILPGIALLKEKLQIVNVDNGVDYRLRHLEHLPSYITPLGALAQEQMEQAFAEMGAGQLQAPLVRLGSREIYAHKRAAGVVWFDFRELCDKPLSQNDYLELAAMFHTVLVSDVPQMLPSMASMARRFTLLIDVLYDRNVNCIVSAAVPAEELYTQGTLSHEFVRTVSRLREMQSAEYMAREHRHVDASIT